MQVIKRINTPLKTLTNGVVDRTMFFGEVVGLNPTIHNNKLFQTFPHVVNLKNALPGIPRKRNRLDIDRSARVSSRPGIPPFQGGRVL